MSAVGSYPTVSPLPSRRKAVSSLWHFPSRVTRVAHAQVLPGSLFTGARTFLEQVRIPARDRPTNCCSKYKPKSAIRLGLGRQLRLFILTNEVGRNILLLFQLTKF